MGLSLASVSQAPTEHTRQVPPMSAGCAERSHLCPRSPIATFLTGPGSSTTERSSQLQGGQRWLARGGFVSDQVAHLATRDPMNRKESP